MFQPFDWMEGGFRYSSISNRIYGITDQQSYKDKSIDLKLRLLKESAYVPQLALGFRDFGGTGWYVVVATVAGFCLGVLVAWVFERSELATFVAACVGSVLAAWLMSVVGSHLGPPDPVVTARHTADNRHLSSDLRVHGATPWFSFPTGALLGLGAVYFATQRRAPRNDA